MPKQPVLFLAHGDPMNALYDNAFTRGLVKLGTELVKPSAIVVVSAHWLSRGTQVGGAEMPETIHDFGGFPDALFQERYPAPGDPALAERIASLLPGSSIARNRGLDHGVWTVLKFLFPQAEVPVVPVSLDVGASPQELVAQGRLLATLREKNVLLVGSGNVVHNVGMYFSKRDEAPWSATMSRRWLTTNELARRPDMRTLPTITSCRSSRAWARPRARRRCSRIRKWCAR